jgi:hypothetical protein
MEDLGGASMKSTSEPRRVGGELEWNITLGKAAVERRVAKRVTP